MGCQTTEEENQVGWSKDNNNVWLAFRAKTLCLMVDRYILQTGLGGARILLDEEDQLGNLRSTVKSIVVMH